MAQVREPEAAGARLPWHKDNPRDKIKSAKQSVSANIWGKAAISERPAGPIPSIFHQMGAEVKADRDWRLSHLAHKRSFNVAVGCVIVLNALVVGVEVDVAWQYDEDMHRWFFFVELLFSVFFAVEMGVRQHCEGWDYFLVGWNVMDYCLVVLSTVDLAMAFFSVSDSSMKALPVLRIVRMLRIVRNIRLLRMFQELWQIVEGMFKCLGTLGWVSLLVLIVVYCVGVYLTMMVGHSESAREYWLDVDVYVGTVPKAMFTAFQIITLDSWASGVLRPMSRVSVVSVVIMLLVIMICTFGLLTVVVGVIVEQTLHSSDQASSTGEGEKEVMDSIRKAFSKLGLGEEMTFEEFRKAIRNPTVAEKLRQLEVPLEEAEEIFRILDSEKAGVVGVEEFFGGVQKTKGLAKSRDLLQIISFMQQHSKRATDLTARARLINKRADVIQARLDTLNTATGYELRMQDYTESFRKDMLHKSAARKEVLEALDSEARSNFPKLAPRDG